MPILQPAIRFTLRQLQYFRTVARAGQISLAAIELHVTQSTMTSAIAELERVLGTLLFERSRSGMALTYEGHLFLQHAHAVLEVADEAARHPFRDRSEVTGTLQLAASYTVLGYFLLPFVAKFQKQHPGVRIVPVEQDRAQIEASISNGDLSMAVALTSNITDIARFEQLPLARSRRQLWVAANHPLADRAQVTLQDVMPFPYILPLVDEGHIAAMRYWEQAGLQPTTLLRTSSMEAVREMVALGLGVTILSDMVFRPWSLDGRRIRTVPLKDAIPAMEVGLVWLRGNPLSPVAEAFRKYLEVSVSSQAAE
ncbi:MAG: LysR family transcriptional regulator [Polaromonas sp.]|nr:LysR family transcriptional regulator [Polaromonas sp.]